MLAAAALVATGPAARAAAPSSEEEAVSTPGVAGEIMDIAVEHCRRGERQQAMAMFQAIRTQLEPPPAILQLILDLEATGCSTAPVASGGALRLQVGGGWDSNVSQGISARSLVLGSGENTIELELDPSYRPRSSAFVQATVDYSLTLPRYGTTLQLALGQRKNTSEPSFDLRTFSAAAAREFRVPVGSLRAQGEVQEVWLGERHYQRSESAALQWLDASPTGAWLATMSTTAVQYVTQPSQNATQFDASLLREWRLNARQSVNTSLTLQRDNAHGARPGGDRQGFQFQVGAVALAAGWRFRPQLAYTQWSSADIFAPGLLEVRRRNRLSQASFQAERPVATNTSLVLEWRGRWARDTISLYKYQGHVLSATLALRF